jgi:glutamate racemase
MATSGDPGPMIAPLVDDRPVGVFDSGMGGLSILREIRRQLPGEHLLYYADTANCPYGAKSKLELQALATRIAGFLVERGAKLVVVACNTASVAALPVLRATFPVPFVGVVPAVKPAALASRAHRVAVLATPATFQGEMFDDLVRSFASDVQVVRQVCPGLVELVEQGAIDGPEARELLQRYLQPAVEAAVDTVVLGCTHYPFLRPLVEEIVGPGVRVIDSGEAVARQVGRVLDARGLRRQGGPGQVTFYTSADAPEALRPVFARLSGEESSVVLRAPGWT